MLQLHTVLMICISTCYYCDQNASHLTSSHFSAPLQVNPVEAKLAKWTRCNLSGEVLHPPCVADELGNLYNKDAMVQALVTKSLPASLSYISSLKHLVDLR